MMHILLCASTLNNYLVFLHNVILDIFVHQRPFFISLTCQSHKGLVVGQEKDVSLFLDRTGEPAT